MLTFPTHLFNPARIQLRLAGSTVTGGESLSGETDVLRTDGGGYWMVQMAGIELIGPDQIRAWRAWEAHLDGGVTQVLLPIADVRQAPRVVGSVPGPLQDDDPSDPYFPEAVGFVSPWVVASTVGAAGLRATQITIDVTQGSLLKGGESFAIAHPVSGRRIYRVGRVISRAGTQATVKVRPPLREALAGGEACDFDWPSLTAVLLPEADISPNVENGHATVNIAFRESFIPIAGELLLEGGGAILLEGA